MIRRTSAWEAGRRDFAASFAELAAATGTRGALDELGYEEPTPIQREAIPPLLAGRESLGQAATGTGKTAAFALPLLQRLGPARRPSRRRRWCSCRPASWRCRSPRRSHALRPRARRPRAARSTAAQPIGRPDPRAEARRRCRRRHAGPGARPPRRGTLDLGQLRIVVLDEADEMLDMGFAEDIEAILPRCPRSGRPCCSRRRCRRASTAWSGRHLTDPVTVRIDRERGAGAAPRVRQTAYIVARAHKASALGRVLDIEAARGGDGVLPHPRRRSTTLTETLSARGYRAEALHGGMTQEQRDRVMRRVPPARRPTCSSRRTSPRAGLDIEHLTHVVNYDLPSAPDSYVHRIGRVGRAGREGVAITLAEPRQHRLLEDDRAGHQAEDRGRDACRPSPICEPAAWSSPARRCTRRCGTTTTSSIASSSTRSPTSTTWCRSRWPR